VASVVPALKPGNDIGTFRKPINNLAFAFVAPLCAHDHYVRHMLLSPDVLQTGAGIAADEVGRNRKVGIGGIRRVRAQAPAIVPPLGASFGERG